MRLWGILWFPGLLLAWAILAFDGYSAGTAVGPLQVCGVVLLVLPALAHWARTSPADQPRLIVLASSIAALLVARLDLLLPILGVPLRPVLPVLSGALLVSAARAYMRAMPGLLPDVRQPSVAAWFRRWRGLFFDMSFAAILPVAFLFLAPIQLFPEPGWVDPAMYIGLSLDFFDIVRDYGWNYHALRVSFLLPNVLANMLLPPVEARLMVVVGFHLMALGSLYIGVLTLWGRPAAVIAVASVAYNPTYLKALTSGYVDAAVVGYMLAMFAVLAAWSRSGRPGWLIAGGALALLTVLAHTVAALPTCLVLLFFLILRAELILAHPARALGYGLLGFVCVWLFFVLALSRAGFGIGAFHTLLWIANASVSGIGANYRAELWDWLPVTTRLLPPLLITASLAVLAFPQSGRSFGRGNWAALGLAASTAAVFPIYDILLGGSTTEAAFYASFTIPGTAIATGALAALLLPRHRHAAAAWAAGITLLVAGITLEAPSLWWLADGSWQSLRLEVAAWLGLGVLAWLLRARSSIARARVLTLAGLMAVQSTALAVNRDTRVVFHTPGTIDHADLFQATLFVRDHIRAASHGGRLPYLWFDRPAFATREGDRSATSRAIRYNNQFLVLNAYDTFAALRLWDRAIFLAELQPGQILNPARIRHPEGTVLFVLGQTPAAFAAARDILIRAGVNCRVRAAAVHDGAAFSLHLTVMDVVSIQPAGAPGHCG